MVYFKGKQFERHEKAILAYERGAQCHGLKNSRAAECLRNPTGKPFIRLTRSKKYAKIIRPGSLLRNRRVRKKKRRGK